VSLLYSSHRFRASGSKAISIDSGPEFLTPVPFNPSTTTVDHDVRAPKRLQGTYPGPRNVLLLLTLSLRRLPRYNMVWTLRSGLCGQGDQRTNPYPQMANHDVLGYAG